MFITPYIYRILIYLPTIPKGIYCLLRLFGKIAGKHILKIIKLFLGFDARYGIQHFQTSNLFVRHIFVGFNIDTKIIILSISNK